MIRLTCRKCRAGLELDDAFAGGVCRCQHCGAIQTVPSHLKPVAAVNTRLTSRLAVWIAMAVVVLGAIVVCLWWVRA